MNLTIAVAGSEFERAERELGNDYDIPCVAQYHGRSINTKISIGS